MWQSSRGPQHHVPEKTTTSNLIPFHCKEDCPQLYLVDVPYIKRPPAPNTPVAPKVPQPLWEICVVIISLWWGTAPNQTPARNVLYCQWAND